MQSAKKNRPLEKTYTKATKTLLGGISPAFFLKHYWQKKPLLIRGAIPNFAGLLSPNELAGLACELDVESRLIQYRRGNWQVMHGPFKATDFAKLPQKDWTLLVQAVNHQLSEATDLLARFDFIPHARLDDLMVSYAPDGGGVGPHFDSYDVFLLQGLGQRLWRISSQADLSLIENAPLKILKNFITEDEFVLEPGDMLYLPPQIAHWGIAVGDCMTYSIGFRAPAYRELAESFLTHLQDTFISIEHQLEGLYQDGNLKEQEHPAKIEDSMLSQVSKRLSSIRWKKHDVAHFLGKYLTDPKPHIVFDTPQNMSETTFSRRVKQQGVQLSLKSIALFDDTNFYINGECVELSKQYQEDLMALADTRKITSSAMVHADQALICLLHGWYQAGYVTLGE